jgi:hypothetical protein
VTKQSITGTTTNISNDTINLQDSTPTTHFTQSNVNTTINNSGINIQVDGVNSIVCSTDNVAMNAELGTEGYYLGTSGAKTFPLVSFAISLYPATYNTTASQLLLGYPDANSAERNNNIRLPYRARVVGFSMSGDVDSHSAVDLTFTIGNALAGAVTRYFRLTGSLAANALQNNSAMANINGTGNNITSITIVNDVEIPIGTRIYFYAETSANFNNDVVYVIYFSQVI